MTEKKEPEFRGEAFINFLASQRNSALDQAAYIAAELSVANERINKLEAEIAKLKEEQKIP